MMSCHYISTQLERIQEAKVGAVERLSRMGSTGLEEQIQTMESAISRIRDEMRRRERPRL
jgi:tryptophan synthase alpha subunit